MESRLIVTHHIRVSGRVQGVFYRKYTALKAAELGVTGWVRNLPNKQVEIMAEGTAAQVSALETWCHVGSPKAAVTEVAVTDVTPCIHQQSDVGEDVSIPYCTERKFSAFDVRR